MRSSLIIAIASVWITAVATAEQPDPDLVPPHAPASPNAPKPDEKDPQAAVNDILNKSLGSVNDCYRGVHSYFNDDYVGWALGALEKKVVEPGGLCDQYRQYSADMPVEIGVPLLPGVSVNIDKLCKMVQRPPCADQPGGADQAKK